MTEPLAGQTPDAAQIYRQAHLERTIAELRHMRNRVQFFYDEERRAGNVRMASRHEESLAQMDVDLARTEAELAEIKAGHGV